MGAVAFHGYAGVAALVTSGFLLWGQSSLIYEGYAAINPMGQIGGVIIMFDMLGFLTGYIFAKILSELGYLRIPKEVELMGLDFKSMQNQKTTAEEVREAQKALT